MPPRLLPHTCTCPHAAPLPPPSRPLLPHCRPPLPQIREVVRMAPTRRQTMLFSATMTEEVKKLVALSLRHPVRWAPTGTAAVLPRGAGSNTAAAAGDGRLLPLPHTASTHAVQVASPAHHHAAACLAPPPPPPPPPPLLPPPPSFHLLPPSTSSLPPPPPSLHLLPPPPPPSLHLLPSLPRPADWLPTPRLPPPRSSPRRLCGSRAARRRRRRRRCWRCARALLPRGAPSSLQRPSSARTGRALGGRRQWWRRWYLPLLLRLSLL